MARGFRFLAALAAAALFGFAQEQPGAPEPPHDPEPTQDPKKCSCTIKADLSGGKIDANGKINVQVKITASVKTTKKSEDKIQPFLAIHQYFVYRLDGKTWTKMALSPETVNIDLYGEAKTCGSNPDKIEKDYSTGPFALVKDGKVFEAAKDTLVECELHLSAAAAAGGGTTPCSMDPLLRYIPFSFKVAGKDQVVSSAEKGTPARPYNLRKDNKGKPIGHFAPSGYGWDATNPTTPAGP